MRAKKSHKDSVIFHIINQTAIMFIQIVLADINHEMSLRNHITRTTRIRSSGPTKEESQPRRHMRLLDDV